MAFRKPGSGIQHRAYREWDRRYYSPESERVGPFEIMDDVICKYRLRSETAAWLEAKIDGIIPHERFSMRQQTNTALPPAIRKYEDLLDFVARRYDLSTSEAAKRLMAGNIRSWNDWKRAVSQYGRALGLYFAPHGRPSMGRNPGEPPRGQPLRIDWLDALVSGKRKLPRRKYTAFERRQRVTPPQSRQDEKGNWVKMNPGKKGVCPECGGKTDIRRSCSACGWRECLANPRRSRKNGTKGAYPFAAKIEQYKKYTMDELLFARKDAREASENMRGHDLAAENWYRDDYLTLDMLIANRREKGVSSKRALSNPKTRRSVPTRVRLFLTNGSVDYRGQQPDWLIFWDKFYTKFGISPEQFAEEIRKLSDADKQALHQMIGPKFPESAVRFVISKMGKRRTHGGGSMEMVVANPSRGHKRYYVALASHPLTKRPYWVAAQSLSDLPPNVIGKVFLVGAKSKRDAILEIKDPESLWMGK
jgi:hypothetical protein